MIRVFKFDALVVWHGQTRQIHTQRKNEREEKIREERIRLYLGTSYEFLIFYTIHLQKHFFDCNDHVQTFEVFFFDQSDEIPRGETVINKNVSTVWDSVDIIDLQRKA